MHRLQSLLFKTCLIFVGATLLLFQADSIAADGGVKRLDPLPLITPGFVGFVPNEIVVKFGASTVNQMDVDRAMAGETGRPEIDQTAKKHGVESIEEQFSDSRQSVSGGNSELSQWHTVRFHNDIDVQAVSDEFKALSDVEDAQPIGVHLIQGTPNDFFFPSQWYLDQTNDSDVDAPEAWDIETGNQNIIVAVADTGVRYFHKDLGGANASYSVGFNPTNIDGNVWVNQAEKNGSAGIDDDGNGFTDDVIGWDFVSSTSNCWLGEDCSGTDNDPRDFNGHGTHVAGIIGAINNNNYASAGVAGGWGNGTLQPTANGVKIMPLRVGYSGSIPSIPGVEFGFVRMDSAAQAIIYAADNGAKLLNASWGSSNTGGLGAAVDYFLASGGLIFDAAGNSGNTTQSYLSSRGDVIDVASTDQNDSKSGFSNFGPWVDISAPGTGILSSYHVHGDPTVDYVATLNGTSMASPNALAVAALIWSQNPSMSANQVKQKLFSTADNIDAINPAYSGQLGAGRVNAFKAVTPSGPPPAPAIGSLTPASGPTSGGNSVVIAGTDFTGASSVTFGGLNATSFTVDSDSQITAVAPAGTAGTVNVSVTTPSGASSNTTSDDYTYVAPSSTPVINLTTLPGTSATIDFAGREYFTANLGLRGNQAASPVVIGTPVYVGNGQSEAGGSWTFNDSAANIDSGGRWTATQNGHSWSLPLTGDGTARTVNIYMNIGHWGGTADYLITAGSTSTTIRKTTRPNVLLYQLEVTFTGSTIVSVQPQASANWSAFTLAAVVAENGSGGGIPAPTVSSVSPSSGSTAGGNNVVIAGTDFTGATTVTFGGLNATIFTVDSDSQITAIAPAGAAGTVDVVVTTSSGTSANTAADDYTYVAPPPPAPAISSLNPTSGPMAGGNSVTIAGANFTGATAATFGVLNASSFTVDSDSQISAVAPAGTAGAVDVAVTTPSGTSANTTADDYTYVAPPPPAPAVSSLSPTSGSTAGGNSVTITGTDFTGASAVTFGGVNATNFNVDSDSQITAVAPAGTAGAVDVLVTTPGGTSANTAADDYTYAAPPPPAPTVSLLTPTSGPTAGGNSVTITGTDFTGATAVTFGGINATSFTVDSDSQITAIALAGAAGTVDVAVTTSSGTSANTAADDYTYVAPPTPAPAISSLNPTSGPTAGGNSVTIAGTNFIGASTVTFGVINATSFTVDSDSQITAVAPAGVAGTVDVAVTTPSGNSANTAADDYTYFTPSSAPVINLTVLPGTSATINFAGREYYTANQGLRGNQATSPVVIGTPVYVGNGQSEAGGGWAFDDGAANIDTGSRWTSTQAGNSWSLPLTGDATARTVSIYMNIGHWGGTANYLITAGTTTITITKTTQPNVLLYRLDVTFTGSTTVSVQPQTSANWSAFTLAAVEVR